VRALIEGVQRREVDPLTRVARGRRRGDGRRAAMSERPTIARCVRRRNGSTGSRASRPSTRRRRSRASPGAPSCSRPRTSSERGVQDPRRVQHRSRSCRRTSATAGSSPRAPGTTGRPSPGPPGRPASRATIVVPEARADGEGRGGARLRARRSSWRGGIRRDGRARACARAETGATFVHAFDDPRVVAGPGDARAGARGQLPRES
jgi:hypothetical protein